MSRTPTWFGVIAVCLTLSPVVSASTVLACAPNAGQSCYSGPPNGLQVVEVDSVNNLYDPPGKSGTSGDHLPGPGTGLGSFTSGDVNASVNTYSLQNPIVLNVSVLTYRVIEPSVIIANNDPGNFYYASPAAGEVPEPAPFLMLGTGIAALVTLRRRVG